MQNVAIDITRLLGRYLKSRYPTGVDRVSLEYIRYFSLRAQAVVRIFGRTLVLDAENTQTIFQVLLRSDFSRRPSIVWQIFKAYFRFRRSKSLTGAFLFNTGHSGLETPGYPQHLVRLGVRPIFFVHDLIPITHPEYCRDGEKEKHVTRMKNALKLACGVITNSQYTFENLSRFALGQGIEMPASAVAMLAPADLSSSKNSRPMAGPYFVMLGTIEPRKNHWMMLQVWRRMLEEHGSNTPKLVIIGQRGWECENVIDLLERCEIIRTHVIELSSCSDYELANYLQHAQALLFPSHVEGFGMPLVEALVSGVPVIVSDIQAFHEIAGDVPEYLDPLDAGAWASEIMRYADSNAGARNSQLRRISDFRATSWPEHFEIVELLLERLQ